MDYTDKAEFYAQLRRDYYDRRPEDRKESFIYKYRKSIKDEKASPEEYERIKNKERKDSYVLLRSCYEGWKINKISLKELHGVISGLIGADIADKDVERTYEDLCNKLIMEDVRNFFYDAGYNTKSADTATPAVRKNNRSRSDEALDMLFEYEKYRKSKGKTDKSGTGIFASFEDRLSDEDFLKECDDLFDLLNDIEMDENQYVFIPVVIDPESGLGIYIVGRALLDPMKEYDRNCYYCCVRFSYDETGAEQFGEYCTRREEHSFEEFRAKYERLLDLEARDIKILKKEFEQGISRFNIPYRLEGDHYLDLRSVIMEFRKHKQTSSDLVGFDILNEPLSGDIEDSDIDYFLKYFVEPEEMAEARRRRKEIERSKRDLYLAMRDRTLKKEAESPSP